MSNSSRDLIDRAMSRLPDTLRNQTSDWIADYLHLSELPDSDLALQSLPMAWSCSPFIARFCLRDPELLSGLLDSGDLETSYADGVYAERMERALAEVEDAEALAAVLRRFRRREMVRIAWRDIAGWAGMHETLRELSDLADACIDGALARLRGWLEQRYGVPRDADSEPVGFYVLGMGKLGGRELNYSSDIDLIFGFSAAGETDGERSQANEQFFTRLGQKLIQALDAQTVDGFVFRVDMRLRPYGDAGPLVMTTDQLETYYESQGREWERYAMIKARVVAGDQEAGNELLKLLRPFVYRRYLDYGALEQLRDMKGMIEKEVQRKGMEHNIKLGRGGIREIEFVGQAFQLIRGGRERGLQERSIVRVLEYLGQHNALPGFAVRELLEGYEYLRRSENRLQAMEDKQTHTLPDEPTDRLRLAVAMGFDRWQDYLHKLDDVRRRVHDHFDQVFAAPQAEGEPRGREDDPQLGDVWADRVSGDSAARLLEKNGFADGDEALKRLLAFREGSHCRALSSNGRARLDRLMPLLLGATSAADQPDDTLVRLLDLLEGVVRRTVYVSLLVEHPMALSQLVKLCSASPWIARHLSRYPVLLDELLDPRTLYAPLKRSALERELAERLDANPEDDLEQQMEVLRQFKQANTLRVAAADVSGVTPLMIVSDYLTDIAEVALARVVDLAWRHLEARHGRPRHVIDGETRDAGFGIIAYGKLGGIELGYGSDLDLVFVFESGGESQQTDGKRVVDNQVFFVRLAQRIIHILGATMAGGVLYEVDTRLRPSGRAGQLATSLDAYAEYQREKAWTWEHQALVRARFVYGPDRLRDGFADIRREILGRRRDAERLRDEVREMRERMRREKGNTDRSRFHLKQDRGGIADIEFMVQYGVLSGAHEAPGLLRYTDNIRLLAELSQCGWLANDDAQLLADAYRAFRTRVHRVTLQEQPPLVPAEEYAETRAAVAQLWHRLMEP